LLALGLFVIALALPAVTTGGLDIVGHYKDSETMYGAQCLAMGLLGAIPAWANPLLGIAAILAAFNRRWLAFICSAAALALALSTFLFVESHPTSLFAIVELRIGCYVWIASIALITVVSWRRLTQPPELALALA
jgi:hypothetical protein